jgi:acetyl esterase/lipase
MSDCAPPIPDPVRALMARLGPVWASDIPRHVREVIDAFDPVLATAPKQGVSTFVDIAYGDDPRQQLDVFAEKSAQPRPVVVFVHGGAFVDGHRNRSAEVYANVLYYFARHGIVGVNIEYRLAPLHPYPSGIEDVAAAIAWVRANIARYGGDPAKIILVGHSAGAAHAAGFAYDHVLNPPMHGSVAGLIVISGRVRADALPENPNAQKVQAYFGPDIARYEALSPVNLVAAPCLPTLVAFAEYENPLIDVYCLELAYRVALAARRAPRVLRLDGHNHTSMIAHINTADDRLGQAMREFIGNTCESMTNVDSAAGLAPGHPSLALGRTL